MLRNIFHNVTKNLFFTLQLRQNLYRQVLIRRVSSVRYKYCHSGWLGFRLNASHWHSNGTK